MRCFAMHAKRNYVYIFKRDIHGWVRDAMRCSPKLKREFCFGPWITVLKKLRKKKGENKIED